MKAIISIKPEFVEKILTKEKKYEFRKRIFKKEIESVIIYSTYPVCKFVGEFKVGRVINKEIDILWEETKSHSGISKKAFSEYFKNYKDGYAIGIEELLEYDKPIEPKAVIPNFKAPQSFCYTEYMDSKRME